MDWDCSDKVLAQELIHEVLFAEKAEPGPRFLPRAFFVDLAGRSHLKEHALEKTTARAFNERMDLKQLQAE